MASPSPVQLERQVMFEDPSTDPRPEMTLKATDWSSQADEDCSPSPPSDFTETLDLTQCMEDNDHASLATSWNETVDWSQTARGDLGDLPVLDPQMCEFLSGIEAYSGRGDEAD